MGIQIIALNIDLLKYSIQCDSNFHDYNKIIYVTCLDQTGMSFDCINDGKLIKINLANLRNLLNGNIKYNLEDYKNG